MFFEPIVTVMLSGILYTTEVRGAPNCQSAKDYAVEALKNPERSATGEWWATPIAIDCTYYTDKAYDIRMTHLDGWHWNKQQVDNPFYNEE